MQLTITILTLHSDYSISESGPLDVCLLIMAFYSSRNFTIFLVILDILGEGIPLLALARLELRNLLLEGLILPVDPALLLC